MYAALLFSVAKTHTRSVTDLNAEFKTVKH